jgi:hypothetical protein
VPELRYSRHAGQEVLRSCGVALTTQPVGHFASPGSYTPRHRAEKILTSKSALEGERKQVTVLFADLKGSMELSTGPLSRLCSNRVAGLRTRAKAMSLDPNVWFENVELVAAQEIGEVTVMYVRNIYKYYVAYQLPRDQSQLL